MLLQIYARTQVATGKRLKMYSAKKKKAKNNRESQQTINNFPEKVLVEIFFTSVILLPSVVKNSFILSKELLRCLLLKWWLAKQKISKALTLPKNALRSFEVMQ